jgi:hypothetical protein
VNNGVFIEFITWFINVGIIRLYILVFTDYMENIINEQVKPVSGRGSVNPILPGIQCVLSATPDTATQY